MTGPGRSEKLSDAFNKRFKIKKLLRLYIQETYGLDKVEANRALAVDEVLSFGGARFSCGDGFQTVGAIISGRKRGGSSRANFFISAEYIECNSQETSPLKFGVYYGRVLKFL